MAEESAVNSDSRTPSTLVFLWALYLGLEILYITNLPLIMDEFQGAHEVLKFRFQLPYRDFLPYKTVLGYYIQLPVLSAIAEPWRALLAVKLEMALLTAASFLYISVRLRDLFSRQALIAATALLIFMSTFLERSAELRVDMLTALAGVLSLIFLCRQRWFVAGCLCAVSFFISQKGVYYLAASLVALIIAGLQQRDGRGMLRSSALFCAGSAAVAAAYLVFWSAIASPATVLKNVFLSHVQIASGNLYDIRWHYWKQTLLRNPMFYALAAFGLLLLLKRFRSTTRPLELYLAPYALVIALAGVWHRQPWPYFFVILLPTFFLLVVVALDRLSNAPELQASRSLRLAGTIALIVGGVLYPLLRIKPNLERDQSAQRSTFQLGDDLLKSGGTYFAGMNYLYHRSQSPVPLLDWLDGPTVAAVRKQPARETLDLIKALDGTETKFLIRNYRIDALPPPFQMYFRSRFDHLWGNVYIYAPRVRTGAFHLKFSAPYLVSAPPGGRIAIDGREYQSGELPSLTAGRHTADSPTTFRLTLIPSSRIRLDPRFRSSGELFPAVYDY